jgi:hypothetical protein
MAAPERDSCKIDDPFSFDDAISHRRSTEYIGSSGNKLEPIQQGLEMFIIKKVHHSLSSLDTPNEGLV